ncbi:MAG: phosphoribulokinase / uridine kinase family [Actinomycetia bacterium]|nr:phosphoribulokinase / uridine kinase family [Actinomycetes bacterium]
MTEDRAAVLATVAARIDALPTGRTVRVVAVDGVTASGKSTFADELVAHVRRPVVRATVDDFNRPRSERYAGGQGPEAYYHDTFDLVSLRCMLLEPLAPAGDRRYRTASFDADNDSAVDAPLQVAPDDAALVLDGVFLLRPELAGVWDLSIFLAVDRTVALERAIARDASWLGGEGPARVRYASRYVPGETLYLESADPASQAGLVVENTDPDRPRLLS